MNEYTTPIKSQPDSVKEAFICDVLEGEFIPVCILRQEIFWNEEYQYVFESLWDVIDE